MSDFLPKIQFTGPLGRDAETGESRNGKRYAKFSVACTPETWEKGAESPPAWWLSCFVFDEDLVDCAAALRKGERVCVIGSLKRVRKDGKEYWNVNVKGVIPLTAKPRGAARQGDDEDDGDVPF